MKKETLKKVGKPVALLATIGALLTTTGCTTYYVNSNGEVVGKSSNAGEVADILNGVGNFLDGAGSALHGTGRLIHSIHHHHHHHGRW
jgi:hypothetical protein